MPKNIYFKGAGLVTAIGDSVEQTLEAIKQERYQPSNIKIEQSEGCVNLPYFTIKQPDISVGADRLYCIIDKAMQQAFDEAGLTEEQLQRTGLFVGSTSFDMFKCEMAIKNSSLTAEDIATHVPPFNRLSSYIQKKYMINGPSYTFNTACTSSANALIYASEFIRRGDITHAVVIGLEFYNEVTALGFVGLELICSDRMRPFEKNRDGLCLGEGCGVLIVSAEPEDHGFSYIAGATLGDNFSAVASNPNGTKIQKVIERGLSQAKIDKGDVAIVKAHGTASLSNDEAESSGLLKVFGESVPPIVALKPFIGHTLGACGINELILFYRSLKNKCLITYPSQISEEFPFRLASNEDVVAGGYYLLNYFGFGGNCTVLVVASA